MLNPIRRTVHRLSLLLTPGSGTHRAGTCPTRHALRPAHPASVCPALPMHRSPYGLHPPLDGAASRLVRPYLMAEVA